MPYVTGEDLVDDVLFRGGEPTDGTSDFEAKVLDYLNQVYVEIVAGGLRFAPNVPRQDWSWLYAEATLTLQTVISTGTVNVTKNSVSGVFSSAPTASAAGWHIRPVGSGSGRVSRSTPTRRLLRPSRSIPSILARRTPGRPTSCSKSTMRSTQP
jgi:hypothetical protein